MDDSGNSSKDSRLSEAIGAIVRHLNILAQTDRRLTDLIEQLGKAFLRMAAIARSSPPDDRELRPEDAACATAELISTAPITDTATQRPANRGDVLEPKQSLADLAGLTFAQPPSAAPAHEQYGTRFAFVASTENLALIETRCRIKAEACRWQLTRRRLLEDGADFRTEIQPLDAEIIDRARNMQDCYLWMCNPNAPIPEQLSR